MKELEKYSFDGVEKTLKHEARNAIGKMKRDAPVDTGRLRREIKYDQKFHDVTFTSKAIDPDTGKDYAPDQEYGTRYIKAHPYFNRNVRLFFDKVRKDIRRKIKNITKKRF